MLKVIGGLVFVVGLGIALIVVDSRREAAQTEDLETLIAGGGTVAEDARVIPASLWINADPLGATVLVDGDSVGVTPIWVEDVTPGPRRVQILARDTTIVDTTLTAEAGLMAELDLTGIPLPQALPQEPEQGAVDVAQAEPPPQPSAPPSQPAPQRAPEPTVRQIQAGDLRITSSPSGATVLLDGREIGTTPLAVDGLVAGRHTIRLSKSGFETVSRRVTVRPSTVVEAAVDLQPRTPAAPTITPEAVAVPQVGAVEVLVRPWGTVFINGEVHQRETDVVYRTQLPAGTHRIRVTHPTLGTATRTIRVQAGSTARIEFDLDDNPAPGGGERP